LSLEVMWGRDTLVVHVDVVYIAMALCVGTLTMGVVAQRAWLG
jgi:hypothetical protein